MKPQVRILCVAAAVGLATSLAGAVTSQAQAPASAARYTKDGKLEKKFQRQMGGTTYSYYSTAQWMYMTPNNRFVVEAGADAAIRVWGLASGRELRCIELGAGFVTALRFTPDGTRLAYLARDHALHHFGGRHDRAGVTGGNDALRNAFTDQP